MKNHIMGGLGGGKIESHQPLVAGWFKFLFCYFLFPSFLRGRVLSLFLINNNPSPTRRTNNPTPFCRSPLALSKMYIFLHENQYFAFPSHIQIRFCLHKCTFSSNKINVFRLQCICTLLSPTTGAVKNVHFPA